MANHRHDAGREKRPAGVIPRKRFGQHFLADRACIDAIVQAIAPRFGDNLVEIGPGTGVLTASLVARRATFPSSRSTAISDPGWLRSMVTR